MLRTARSPCCARAVGLSRISASSPLSEGPSESATTRPGLAARLPAIGVETGLIALSLSGLFAWSLLSQHTRLATVWRFMWSDSLSYGLPLMVCLGIAGGLGRAVTGGLRTLPRAGRVAASCLSLGALAGILFLVGEFQGLWVAGLLGTGSVSGALELVSSWPELAGFGKSLGNAPASPSHHFLLALPLVTPFALAGLLRSWGAGTGTRNLAREVTALALLQLGFLSVPYVFLARASTPRFMLGDYAESGYRLFTLGSACCLILPLARRLADRFDPEEPLPPNSA